MSMVMVVDDEPAIRRLLSIVLNANDWETVTAGDAESALDAIDARAPDVILADIRLPGMDGIEFAQKVRSNVDSIPIAFISAWEEPPRDALGAGAPVAYFRKPFDVDAIAAWVSEVLLEDPDQ